MTNSDNATSASDANAETAPIKPRKEVPEHLSSWELGIFSSPAIPLAVFFFPVGFLLPPYYTGELGISLTAWAGIIFVARVFDMITDPIVGIFCDRYPSRWGRRRHWMLIATPMLMLACVLLLLPEYFVDSMTVVYAMSAMCFLQLGQTIYGLNAAAWGAELSEDYHERSRIMGWRGLFGGIAPFIAIGIPAVVERLNPGATNGEKIFYVAFFVLPLLPLLTGAAVATVGERPDRSAQKETKMTFLESWKLLMTNTIMLRLVLIEIAAAIPFSISIAVSVFYVTFVLEEPSMGATALIFPLGAAFISIPIWMRIATHFEKHKILTISYSLTAILVIPLAFLQPGDIKLYLVITTLMGVFSSGPAFIMQSIIADVVDSDTLATGEQRTGTFYALIQMTQKFIPTIAVLFVFPYLQWMGFDPSSDTNPEEGINALRYVFGLFPPIPMVIVAVLLYSFPLGKEKQEEIRQQINENRDKTDAELE